MKVDPRYLRYLQAIDDHGTFIRAAEEEGISQPALTNKIIILERQLGTQLIDRGRFGARLNTFGKLLLRHAKAIDAVLDRAYLEIELAKLGEGGTLVIGATPISLIELLPRALRRMDEENPRIRVSIIEGFDDQLLELLLAGEVDIIVGGMLVGERQPDIVGSHLIDLPLDAVIGKASKLWERDDISFSELLEHDWVLPSSGNVIRSYVDSIFVAAGENIPSRTWTCTSLHALKLIIQYSKRVSLMPSHAFAPESDAGILKRLKLLGPTSSRKLNVLRLKHVPPSPLLDPLIENLRDVATKISDRESRRDCS